MFIYSLVVTALLLLIIGFCLAGLLRKLYASSQPSERKTVWDAVPYSFRVDWYRE